MFHKNAQAMIVQAFAFASKSIPPVSQFSPSGLHRMGVSTIHAIPNSGIWLRAFLRCGETYSVHPVDVVHVCGRSGPLPTVRGLVPSHFPEFEWQVDTHRRMLFVRQAEIVLIEWADGVLAGTLGKWRAV